MRILGLDAGTKRLGVAISDEMGWTAQPLDVIQGRSQEEMAAALKDRVAEYDIDRVVIGLPKHMNGSEGASAEMARKLGEMVQNALGVEVEYWDERLTSVAAERVLLEANVRRKKRKAVVDKIAATMILQGWLDARTSSGSDGGAV